MASLASKYEVFAVFSHQMGAIREMWGESFELQRNRRYDRSRQIVSAAAACDLPVIVEGTFGRAAERGAIRATAETAGAPFILVYAHASRHEVVLDRFRHRSQQNGGPDHRACDPQIYFDSLSKFEVPSFEEIAACDGYAEIDSSLKCANVIRAEAPSVTDVLLAVENAYHEVEW